MPEDNEAALRVRIRKTVRPLLRAGLAVWLIQTLVLASGALLLMFWDAGWADLFEQQRLLRNFTANPVQMVIVEAFGTLRILIGISGLCDNDGFSLDVVWAGYMPLFVGVCLTLLFMGGLFRPWWLFR